MNQHPTTPSRKQAKIKASICRQCFVAVPSDQLAKHEAWHDERKLNAAQS